MSWSVEQVCTDSSGDLKFSLKLHGTYQVKIETNTGHYNVEIYMKLKKLLET